MYSALIDLFVYMKCYVWSIVLGALRSLSACVSMCTHIKRIKKINLHKTTTEQKIINFEMSKFLEMEIRLMVSQS